jgi:tRNA (guanine-N7-)-methyltransferase
MQILGPQATLQISKQGGRQTIGTIFLFWPAMGQKKLLRFEAIKSFPNVLQYPPGMPGQWAGFFKNTHPLVLELACGKGEYAVGLARMNPDQNHIGVDLKGNRIYVGARICLEENIHNAAFLRTQIDKIPEYFSPGEVSEIWLTFPDPQLRRSRAKKRLTHPRFLRLYQQILWPGGLIHLKTDSPVLYHFTLRVIDMYGLFLHESAEDIHSGGLDRPALQIRTHYENLDIAKSRRVHYICFSLPADALPAIDGELQKRIMEDEQPIH